MRKLILKTPKRLFGGDKGLPNFEAEAYTNEELAHEFNNLDHNIKNTLIKSLYTTARKIGLTSVAQKVS